MNYYIRNFHFKSSFFSRKTYICFEFFIGDKWRKGKVSLIISKSYTPTVGDVSSLIISYINNFCENKRGFWTELQLKTFSQLTEQFGKDVIKDSTRLFK